MNKIKKFMPSSTQFHMPKNYFIDMKFQNKYSHMLNNVSKSKTNDISRNILAQMSYQSLFIEGYSLSIKDALKLSEDLDKIDIYDIKYMLTLSSESNDHIDLIKQLFVTRLVNDMSFRKFFIYGDRLKFIHKLLIKNGGAYRNVSIQERCYPSIFPFPEEVQPRVNRLLTNHLEEDENPKDLHPIISSSRLFVNFLQISPFTKGNGNLGRLLLNSSLIRRGYPPCIFKNKEYSKMIYDAQTGDVEKLYLYIIDSLT